MKHLPLLRIFLSLLILIQLLWFSQSSFSQLENGDIIFHQSKTQQSKAIALATDCKYTHVGLIFFDAGSPYVYEAVQPVRRTLLNDWIKRGKDQHYVVKRLKHATPHKKASLKSEVSRMLGKDYDFQFDWSDQKIYCSELVWKAYHRTYNIKLGKLKTLREFKLVHPIVKKALIKRYGSKISYSKKINSPAEIFHSSHLVTVQSKKGL
ncbi:MAG: YiiX family permuted papain-like enzyme [Verrucomicrobiota bacterium]